MGEGNPGYVTVYYIILRTLYKVQEISYQQGNKKEGLLLPCVHHTPNTDSCALLGCMGGCTPINFVSRYISLHHWSTLLSYKTNEKTLKCKPSANCACVIPLIDGLGYSYVFTRGLPLVACGESDTG